LTKLFNNSHQFKLADEFDMGIKYPIIIESENSDGSVTGKFDIDQMSTVKKILALEGF